jgi:pimeloyl-ACP methyl ester carboxylesterase
MTADYVLVHGGQRDGSLWDKVASLLKEQGHRVFAPSLSKPEISTLSEHISEVCKLIDDENLNSIVLVGHSYASMVITGVADRIPNKIKHLIYVDCAVPVNGMSLYGMFEPLGITSEAYGLPQDPPFLEPLYFDEKKIRKIPKTYVHCTQSEFIAVGKPAFEKVVEDAERDNWDFFQLDSDHPCMISHPVELAEILLREQD